MPTCPYCNEENPKLKSRKRCPSCEKTLYVFEEHWYKSNPSQEILKHFSYLLSIKLSKEKEMDIVYRIGTKSPMYSYSLVKAKQILKACDYELDTALKCLDIIFQDKRYNWRINDSITQVQPALPVVLSIIRAQQQEEEKREKRSKPFESMLKDREKLFNE